MRIKHALSQPAIFVRRHFALFVILLLAGRLGASPFYGTPVRILPELLSQSYITHLSADRNGFLWISTLNGTWRYDGVGAHKVKLRIGDDGGSQAVTWTGMDNGGRMWAKNYQGFYIYKPREAVFAKPTPDIFSPMGVTEAVDNVWVGNDGQLWIATALSVYCIDRRSRKRWTFAIPDAQKVMEVCANSQEMALLTTDGHIYMATLAGKAQSLTLVQRVAVADGSKRPTAGSRLMLDRSHRVWVYTPHTAELTITDTRSGLRMAIPTNTEQQLITDITEDAKGNILATTDNHGLLLLTPTATAWLPTNDDMPSHHANSVYYSKQGNIYVGLAKQGLVRLTTTQPTVELLPLTWAVDVRSITETSAGDVWVSMDGAGLARTTTDFSRHTSYSTIHHTTLDTPQRQLLSDMQICALDLGAAGMLFGTYGGGITRWQNGRFTPISTSMPIPYVNDMVYDENGYLWVTAFNNGLFRIGPDGTTTAYDRQNSDLETNAANALARVDNQLYIATGYGLYTTDMHRPKINLVEADDIITPTTAVRTIYCDSRRLLWIGTTDGLLVYSPQGKKAQRIDRRHGLNATDIIGLTEDRQGNIWANSKNTISRIQITAQLDAGNRYNVRTYALPDDVVANNNALTTLSNGEVLLGTIKGICHVNPSTDVQEQTPIDRVFVTCLYSDEQVLEPGGTTPGGNTMGLWSLADGDEIVLDYADRNISVDVATPGRPPQMLIAYEWRLKGETEWTVASSAHIPLGALTPGNHLLEIRVTGTDNENYYARLPIHINHPLWQIVIMVLFVLLAVAVVSALLSHYALRRLRKNKAIAAGKAAAVKPQEIELTSVDEMLLKKAIACVEENIDNLDFSVEQMATSLGMTRGHLYRRLMQVSGKSPVEFIRDLRLQRGEQILRQTGRTVAETAYMVGLSPKLFARYFREKYGVLPSQYAKKENDEQQHTDLLDS